MKEILVQRMQNMYKLAVKYYSKEKLDHAVQVAEYAQEKAILSRRCDENVYIIGLAHDLLEDTDCSVEEIREACYDKAIVDSIILLTKTPNESYEDYIKRIVSSDDWMAKLVKQADMKDHFARLDTLTPKLIDKYTPVLKYLL